MYNVLLTKYLSSNQNFADHFQSHFPVKFNTKSSTRLQAVDITPYSETVFINESTAVFRQSPEPICHNFRDPVASALTMMETSRPTDAVRSPAPDTRGFATVRAMKIITPLMGLLASTTCKIVNNATFTYEAMLTMWFDLKFRIVYHF